MTIPEAIKRAIGEGYKSWKNIRGYEKEIETIVSNIIIEELDEVFLDPEFWKCLGKAMGWMNVEGVASEDIAGKLNGNWGFYWHRFIDALASGKSAEKFFEELK